MPINKNWPTKNLYLNFNQSEKLWLYFTQPKSLSQIKKASFSITTNKKGQNSSSYIKLASKKENII